MALMAILLGGAVALAYRKLNERIKEGVYEGYLESIDPYRNKTGYDIPGEFLIVSGKKFG